MPLNPQTAYLRPHEVRVTDGRQRGTRPGRIFHRGCFRRALRYVLDHGEERPDVRLVHGRVLTQAIGEPVRIDHGWVEFADGIVFDGVLQRFYTKAGYYAAQRATVADVYDLHAAARLCLATGHCGPWTAEERAAGGPSAPKRGRSRKKEE